MTRTRTLALALLVPVAVGVGSCAPAPDTSQLTKITTPDYLAWEGKGTTDNPGVHTFLEKRCGTLDCHGQLGRPFRLFSQNGLRAVSDAGDVSGGAPDTADEIYTNYLSAIGLQPEEMSRVVSGDDPPTDLLLVAKPTEYMGTTHKGGQVINVGDVSYNCLVTWLTFTEPVTAEERATDAMYCAAAAAIP
jgi:hypothetical protein